MNISQILLETAQELPQQPAIVFRNQTVTYKEFAQRVKEKTVGLKEHGITKKSHVGLMMANKPDYAIAYFALLAIGATVVPINPTFKEQEITYILNDSDAMAIIVDEVGLEEVKKARKNLYSVERFFSLTPTEQFTLWTEVSGDPTKFTLEPKNPNDNAQIIYTSGTTGKPKGALITHGNLEWMCNTSSDILELTKEDRVLVVLPLFHAYAKLQGLLQCVLKGCTIYLEERFIPDLILQKLSENKITIFLGVPTMYTMFVHSPKIKELDFTSLRIAGSGGASLPLEIIDKVKAEMGVELGEGYGQTESTVMISCNPSDVPKKYGSVGVPLPNLKSSTRTAGRSRLVRLVKSSSRAPMP